MKMPLTLNPKYWFGEKVMFDCRGRKGLGEIEAISLSQHNEVSYEILVVDEPYDIQGTVFENEIVSTESKKKIPNPVEIRPRFSFGQCVSIFRSQKRFTGCVYGISIDRDFNFYYEIRIENTSVHAPMVPENDILLL